MKHETLPLSGVNRQLGFVGSLQGWSLHPLEQLRNRHFLRNGSYQMLKYLVPLIALFVVWFHSVHGAPFLRTRNLLDVSVSVRHLILGITALVCWCVASLRARRRKVSAMGELKAEIFSILLATAVSGLPILLEDIARGRTSLGVELTSEFCFVSLVSSVAVLVLAALSSADIVVSPTRIRHAIVLGTGPRAQALRKSACYQYPRLRILGCLDDVYSGSDPTKDLYLGEVSKLSELLKQQPIDLVLIGLPVRSQYETIQQVINVCESVGVEAHYAADVFAAPRSAHTTSQALGLITIGNEPRPLLNGLKRLLDLVVALPVVMLALPIMCCIALAIKLTSPGPVFFVQQRYGHHRNRFAMYKFRTMVVDAEKRQDSLENLNEAGGPTFKLKHDPRITRIGRLLRRTSLDELPQLLNVLKGDMSLVGPRPLPIRDVSKFEEAWLLRRFSVKPGLTCLWQVGGRSNTTFDHWMKQDLEYIDRWSLGLDVAILARTVPAVFRGEGAM